MRLLNTHTLELKSFDSKPYPAYAILSHRWGLEEVSFEEFDSANAKHKLGFKKIQAFCAEAQRLGFEWCWIDTCNIDKRSSAELSESINSMYKWYEDSAVCLVYLADVSASIGDLKSSDWFNRGWTLQELIAPDNIEFYDCNWVSLGSKDNLVEELCRITKIDEECLRKETPLWEYSVAAIMSWASRRVTTRPEDIAYCLLGLFDVHMPSLYGEGDRAFERLQEEIIKQTSDQSLFAWNPTASMKDKVCSILAPSPACFAESGDIVRISVVPMDAEVGLTNRGLHIRMPFFYDSVTSSLLGILACLSTTPFLSLITIEFKSYSRALEDQAQLERVMTDMKYRSAPRSYRMRTVYLETRASLRGRNHATRLPLYTFQEVYLFDAWNHRLGHSLTEVSPPSASPCVRMRPLSIAPVALIRPVHDQYISAALRIQTSSGNDIVVTLGYDTAEDGLVDLQRRWCSILGPIAAGTALEDESLRNMAMSEATYQGSLSKQTGDIEIIVVFHPVLLGEIVAFWKMHITLLPKIFIGDNPRPGALSQALEASSEETTTHASSVRATRLQGDGFSVFQKGVWRRLLKRER